MSFYHSTSLKFNIITSLVIIICYSLCDTNRLGFKYDKFQTFEKLDVRKLLIEMKLTLSISSSCVLQIIGSMFNKYPYLEQGKVN